MKLVQTCEPVHSDIQPLNVRRHTSMPHEYRTSNARTRFGLSFKKGCEACVLCCLRVGAGACQNPICKNGCIRGMSNVKSYSLFGFGGCVRAVAKRNTRKSREHARARSCVFTLPWRTVDAAAPNS